MVPFLRSLIVGTGVVLVCSACGQEADAPASIQIVTPNDAPSQTQPVRHDYRESITSDPAVVAACNRFAAAEVAYESHCTIAIHPEKQPYYADRFNLACRVAASEPGVSFDVAAIDHCAEALGEWREACTHRPLVGSIRDPLEVCRTFLSGTLASGEDCTADAQCSSGKCWSEYHVRLGQREGTVARSFSTCGTCTKRVELGEICDRLDPNVPGHVFATCREGTGCVPNCSGPDCTTGTCVAGAPEGAECNIFLGPGCAAGSTCKSLESGASWKCVAPQSVGTLCREQNECGPDLVCRDGKCAHYAKENEKCRVAGATIPLDTGCIGSLECSPSTLTCVQPSFGNLKSDGEGCGRELLQVDECASGSSLCALEEQSVCSFAMVPEGGECSDVFDCDAVSLCLDGICQPITTVACKAEAELY